MVYVKDPPAQRFVLVPVMVPGCAVVERTVNDLTALFPQVLPAETVMAPLVNGVGNITEMEVDPCPLLIVAPAGTVQV